MRLSDLAPPGSRLFPAPGMVTPLMPLLLQIERIAESRTMVLNDEPFASLEQEKLWWEAKLVLFGPRPPIRNRLTTRRSGGRNIITGLVAHVTLPLSLDDGLVIASATGHGGISHLTLAGEIAGDSEAEQRKSLELAHVLDDDGSNTGTLTITIRQTLRALREESLRHHIDSRILPAFQAWHASMAAAEHGNLLLDPIASTLVNVPRIQLSANPREIGLDLQPGAKADGNEDALTTLLAHHDPMPLIERPFRAQEEVNLESAVDKWMEDEPKTTRDRFNKPTIPLPDTAPGILTPRGETGNDEWPHRHWHNLGWANLDGNSNVITANLVIDDPAMILGSGPNGHFALLAGQFPDTVQSFLTGKTLAETIEHPLLGSADRPTPLGAMTIGHVQDLELLTDKYRKGTERYCPHPSEALIAQLRALVDRSRTGKWKIPAFGKIISISNSQLGSMGLPLSSAPLPLVNQNNPNNSMMGTAPLPVQAIVLSLDTPPASTFKTVPLDPAYAAELLAARNIAMREAARFHQQK